VNQDIADRIASKHGAAVFGLNPIHPLPFGLYDAVLYNLDGLSSDQLVDRLAELCAANPGVPVAVHGYGLTDEQALEARQCGIASSHRLRSDLVRSLIQAARAHREVVARECETTDLTWVDLAK
jgi:hypothetical protein